MGEKNVEISSMNPSTKEVVNLLTGILETFREQVLSKTPPPLVGDAVTAVEAFKEIKDALDLKPAPNAAQSRQK